MQNKFTLTARAKSFKYAFKGILILFKSQHNTWIHALLTSIAILFGILYKINLTEWCLIVFSIGLVFSVEAINTAIENLIDMISPEHNKKAGIIKDIGAGAVLIAAIAAASIGFIIFIPKIFF